MKRILLIFGLFTLLVFPNVKAQVPIDTLVLMHYNLMYYDETTTFCTATNNNVTEKNEHLKTIFGEVMPDILTVNEMGRNISGGINTSAKKLLDNALNVGGVNYYKRAGESGASNLCNMLYYNSQKVELQKQRAINDDINGNALTRTIDLYTLYIKTSDLSTTHDTVKFTCVVAHLKAGSTQSDIDERAAETAALMAKLNAINKSANRFFLGDFNVEGASEPCFDNLINHTNTKIRFYDPINSIGEWGTTGSLYKDIHTQSTLDIADNTGWCHSAGGMDDRFDFILASDYIINDVARVKVVPNTYRAIGQDGNKWNLSLDTLNNGDVPVSVAKALFWNSDHLPVMCKIKVGGPPPNSTSELTERNEKIGILARNPVEDSWSLLLTAEGAEHVTASIISTDGRLVKTEMWGDLSGESTREMDMKNLAAGVYFLQITSTNKRPATYKFYKE